MPPLLLQTNTSSMHESDLVSLKMFHGSQSESSNLEDGHSGSWKLSYSVSTMHLSALGVFCEFFVQAMDFYEVLSLHLSSGVLTPSSKQPSAGDEQSHKVG
ncbi:hypothetical protein KC19_6G179600 [Ceratodon purpureus]|uniref:Uncharacterized protein n=1 Tax=Ceratodon purpureus TaxID=3225 RepID=A0A8T0HIN7_CERPU|nr:hypothetical protein KC19_6G179600 [Ceratodon purpureus]